MRTGFQPRHREWNNPGLPPTGFKDTTTKNAGDRMAQPAPEPQMTNKIFSDKYVSF
jgi:hypothetical protein